MLGTLNFHQSVPRPASPMPSSPSEMVQVDVSRYTYEEGLASGAPPWEMMVEAPPPVGAVGANMAPRVHGGHVKDAGPRPEDAPGLVALTLRFLMGPGFSLSWEAALDDVMSIPESSDIADLRKGVLGLPRFNRAPLRPASWRQVAGGAKSTCSQVATVCLLLKEMLAMVGQDVLQPA
jgi:hypothetical protein